MNLRICHAIHGSLIGSTLHIEHQQLLARFPYHRLLSVMNIRRPFTLSSYPHANIRFILLETSPSKRELRLTPFAPRASHRRKRGTLSPLALLKTPAPVPHTP